MVRAPGQYLATVETLNRIDEHPHYLQSMDIWKTTVTFEDPIMPKARG